MQIVDAALADATRRAQRADGTSWLACHPGCTPCCHGVFKISMLDAERLLSALRNLEVSDPETAMNVRQRARNFTAAFASVYPGDTVSGLLHSDEEAWEAFANSPLLDLPCPALSPLDGRCELYEGRPLTCRIFGPPVRSSQGMGVCELCYVDADVESVVAGQMYLTHGQLEGELDRLLPEGETIIAWTLASATNERAGEHSQ